jgi:prepilin-type N-terminal cleavage/methylation domain-containing protein
MSAVTRREILSSSRIELMTQADNKMEELRAFAHTRTVDTLQLAIGGSITVHGGARRHGHGRWGQALSAPLGGGRRPRWNALGDAARSADQSESVRDQAARLHGAHPDPLRLMRTRRLRSGFTLAELLVSLVMLGIVLGAVMGTVLTTQQEFFKHREIVKGQDALRNAEIIIGTVLRAAGADPANTKQAKLEPNPLNHAVFDNVRTFSDFNPVNGVFTDPLEDVLVHLANDTLYVRWQAGTLAQPVAYPVRSLQFEYFASNGTLLTNVADIVGATRVRMTLTAPRSSKNATLERRQSWIYLRNRR